MNIRDCAHRGYRLKVMRPMTMDGCFASQSSQSLRSDRPGSSVQPVENSKGIFVPEYLWKIAVVLEPGQQISDITEETEVIAIITPNRSTLSSTQNNYPLPNGLTKNIPAGQWNKWEQWKVSVDYLEEITKYDFLSNVPEAIQEIIEQQGDTSASLLATTDEDRSLINNFSINPDGFLIGTETQINTFDDSTTKVSFIKRGVSKDSISEISILEIGTDKSAFLSDDIFHTGISKVSTKKSAKAHISSIQDSSFQVNPIEKDIFQISTSQIDSSKVSFASNIASDQFSSFHKHNSTPEIINELNNSATKIWSDLLQSETQLDINFQITDLPTRQLAEATIIGFN